MTEADVLPPVCLSVALGDRVLVLVREDWNGFGTREFWEWKSRGCYRPLYKKKFWHISWIASAFVFPGIQVCISQRLFIGGVKVLSWGEQQRILECKWRQEGAVNMKSCAWMICGISCTVLDKWTWWRVCVWRLDWVGWPSVRQLWSCDTLCSTLFCFCQCIVSIVWCLRGVCIGVLLQVLGDCCQKHFLQNLLCHWCESGNSVSLGWPQHPDTCPVCLVTDDFYFLTPGLGCIVSSVESMAKMCLVIGGSCT